LSAERGKATGLEPGDVIEQLDGVAVGEWIRRWTPYYAASNETTRLRDIGRSMTRGDCARLLDLRIRRRGEALNVKVARIAVSPADLRAFAAHDRPGDAFQLLSPEVAYLKLSGAKAADARRYVDSAAKTKGLIIDIRNYPAEFVVFALGELLVDRPTEFARFTIGDLSNPGAFHWGPTVRLEPKEPRYGGRIVILADETSLSQAEYTAMAFRSARNAIVIGSTTAAADGNVSQVPLPGAVTTMITGIGVFYPDKRPTQRIGIIPDREVKPTIAGIRDGRDEVLEAAVRAVLGAGTPEAEVQRIANGK
jgi:C-terminal processing protease CtpA/Prc